MAEKRRTFLVALAAITAATTIIHRGQFQLDWFLVWVLYLGQISLSSFVYGLRPSGLPAEAAAEPEAEVPPQRKDPVWFWGVRLLTVPALVGLAEWALRIEATWLAVLAQVGVWLYLALVILFAVGEILVRLFQTVEGAGFFDAIQALLDAVHHQPARYPLRKYEWVEKVEEPSPLLVVWPFALLGAAKALVWGLVLGWLLSLVRAEWSVWGVTYSKWPLVTVPLTVTVLAFIYKYSIAEWNRRHTRFIWTTRRFITVTQWIENLVICNREINPGLLSKIPETRASVQEDIWYWGRPTGKTHFLWRWYASWLYSKFGLGKLKLLTFIVYGYDALPGCPNVQAVSIAHDDIFDKADERQERLEWEEKRLWLEELGEELGEEANFDEVLEIFEAYAPADAERIDLMTVSDPRHYSATGERIAPWPLEAGAGRPPAAPARLPGFQPVGE